MTITLNASDNDFCGGNLNINYSDNDVKSGYKNGDLAFWTIANNFVIFINGEENSSNIGNLVKLGRITEPQEKLEKLQGTIDVTIALVDKDTNIKETQKNASIVAKDEDNNMATKQEASEVKVKITVGDTQLIADMEDNVTTRELIAQMPMTLHMMNLYGREMCYRYGAYALSTDNLQSNSYEVGDIAYWSPAGSLVILYKQNGEHFERQHLGHINSGVELFQNIGDVDVTFELAE